MSLTRPSAIDINKATGPEITLNLPGYGKEIPVVYGVDRLPGLWLVRPVVDSPLLVFAIAWCWGEIDSIQAVYINGAAVPGGVTMTHYTGTTSQGIDTTLSAALAGFGDTYPKWAYTVFQVPTGTIGGFPQTLPLIEAVIRGKQVHDPRTDTFGYSKNPALCLADFIQSTDYGPGLPVYGVTEAANRCDQSLGGNPRCEIGLSLRQPATADATIGLLSAYAECLRSYSDDGVLLVPDAPVESPAATLAQGDIIEDSFRIRGQDMSRSPTVVTVTYREPSGGPSLWQNTPATQKLAGVDTGDVEEIRSDVSMPGIHRLSEASRKALLRLRRLSRPTSYSWDMFDNGIQFQRGDVVQLPNIRGLSSQLVRILSRDMTARGIYAVTAEPYSADMYPDDFIPDSTTDVPVGGIIPFEGSTTPDGWALFTDADDLLIIGADDVDEPGDTGGSASITVSGTSSLAGAHTGNPLNGTSGWIVGASGTGGVNTALPEEDHDHTYTQATSRTPLYRQSKLIKKTGTAGPVPTNGILMADGQLIRDTLAEVTTHLGRLLRAGSSVTTGGSSGTFNLTIPLSAKAPHNHDAGGGAQDSETPNFGPNAFDHIEAGGHNHPGSGVSVTLRPKKKNLVFYLASGPTEIQPGGIIGFDPAEPVPTGWYECDGDNGTPDLRKFYIARSSLADAGNSTGDNTVTWGGITTTELPHDHKGTNRGNKTARDGLHFDAVGGHEHETTGSDDYRAPWYAMKFIQYTGVV